VIYGSLIVDQERVASQCGKGLSMGLLGGRAGKYSADCWGATRRFDVDTRWTEDLASFTAKDG